MIRSAKFTALVFVVVAVLTGEATAQGDERVLRGQTNQQIQRSIQTQVQHALYPSLAKRDIAPRESSSVKASGGQHAASVPLLREKLERRE